MGRRAKLPGPGPIESLRVLPSMLRAPYRAMPRLHERHGPIVQLGFGPLRYVFVCGAAAQEMLLSERTASFRWREATALLIPVDGDTALIVSDGDEHRRRRRLVQPAFGIKRVESYLPLVLDEVGRVIDAWEPGATVDVAQDLRRAVRRIVVRSLFGDRLRDRADEIGEHLEAAIAYVNRSPAARFDHDWPGTPYRRAMAARRRADAIVYAEIEARRAAATDDGDVLSALVAAQEDGDHPLTDEEVRDQVVSLIAAGYDTTTAGVAWAVHATFSRPEVRDRARAEVVGALGDAPPTVAQLAALPYLDGIVSESLRLWPPGPFGARYAVEDVPFGGHVIPAGSIVAYSPYVSHRLPDVWPDPDRFDPERWIPGSPTFHEPTPYAYVPFGGGSRRCIGFALATLEIRATLAELLRRVDITPLDPEPDPTGIATMSPKGGIRATVRPRS
ncbi:MAG TPA: cytochrome P450 [Iamia sp.]